MVSLLATIRDVAKLAGVSVATVSRVLNKNGYVNIETEQKVTNAIKQLQYEPNAVARGLAGKQTGTIALILPDISNPFFPEVARGVEDVAHSHGYTVILCNSDDQGSKERSYIEVLKKKYIDGIIFASSTLEDEDITQMRKSDIPLVLLDRAPNKESCSVVRVKNYEGAQLAVQHLLEIGCNRIAHIYGPQDMITARQRLSGYEDAVKSFDWFSPSLMVEGNFRIDGGQQAIETLINRHPDIDGLFAGNDLMAVGAVKALTRMGKKVPDDIAVIGFDGIGLTEIVEPELTTIAQPIYEMGRLAATTLIQKITGERIDNQIRELDVKLIVRDSTNRSR